MEIKYLRDFVVLADTGNFSEAADSLFSSQSTLSKHIHTIEDELGVKLFERTTRKVKISKFGELLLPFARQIVALQEEYFNVLQNDLSARQSTLVLGSIKSLAQYKITDVLGKFKQNRPQSAVKIIYAVPSEKQVGSRDLLDKLRQKQCELAFIRYYDEIDDDLVTIPYADDSLVAVFPINHPLAKRKSIPIQMLSEFEILLIEKYSQLNNLCFRVCRQYGFEPNVVFTDAKPENLVELVINGLGIALLMKQLAMYFSNNQITLVDITPTITSHICLCYLKDVELSEAAREFVRLTELQREKNQAAAA